MKHYLLAFHDEMLECLAEGFRFQRLHTSFPQALDLARQQLTDDADED